MAKIPAALLSNLYEKGSLRNTDTGFELAFRNRMAPITVQSVGPLIVDGRTFERDVMVVRLERPAKKFGKQAEPLLRTGKDFKDGKSLLFDLNCTLRVSVTADRLPAGSQRVSCMIQTREMGDMVVQAEDGVDG